MACSEKRSPPYPNAAATVPAKRTKSCPDSCDSSEELDDLRGLLISARGEIVVLSEENYRLQSEIKAVAAERDEASVRAENRGHITRDLAEKLADATDKLDAIGQSRDQVRLSLMLCMMPHIR